MMFRIQIFLTVALLCGGNYCQASQLRSINDDFGLAAGHYERQEYNEAIVKFREVIQKHPSTRHAAMSYFFLGESFVQQSNFEAAFPAYKIFLERLPQDDYAKRARFRLAECAYRLNWETQAPQLLEDFLVDFPNDALNEFTLTYLGELRLKRGEPQIALEVFDKALTEFPQSSNTLQNRFGLAKSLQELGRISESSRFYELVLSDPTSPLAADAELQLGIIAFEQDDFAEAKRRFSAALTFDGRLTKSQQARYWLAKTEMALGNPAEALSLYKTCIKTAQDPAVKVAVLFDGSVAAAQSQESEIALEWIEKIQTTWPESKWADDALKLKIELLYQRKRYAQTLAAIKKFENEFAANQQLPKILEYKGRIRCEQKQHAETVAIFQRLIDDFGNDAVYAKEVSVWNYFRGLGEMGQQEFQKAARTFADIDTDKIDEKLGTALLLARASTASALKLPQEASRFLTLYLATTSVDGEAADRVRADLSMALAMSDQWDKLEDAIGAFRHSHSSRQTFLNSQLAIAELALKNKRYDLSERCFQDLTDSSNPRELVVQGLSGLAWVRMTRGDQQSSVEVFEKLVAEFAETRFAAEAAMACARHFEQQKQFAKAIEMYQHVNSQFSDSSFQKLAKLRLAYCLTKVVNGNKTYSQTEVEQILREYLQTETEFLDDAQYQLAWLCSEQGNNVEALELFEKVVSQKESSFWNDAAYRVARSYIELDRITEAESLLIELADRKPAPEIRTRISFLQGQLAAEQQNWLEVQTKMKTVLQETDDELLRKRSRYWLAESLFQAKQFDNAIPELERLIESPDLIAEKRRAWLSLRLAQSHAYQERWTSALDMSEKAIQQYPEFEAKYEFHFIIGRAHAAQGRLTEARKAYKKVIASKTGNSTQTAAMAQWRIGETYFHQENYERAIESFYRVDSLYGYDKWRAAALVEAGKCQEHLGNWNHAAKLYEQLIAKFPNSEFSATAMKRLHLATRQASRAKEEQNK